MPAPLPTCGARDGAGCDDQDGVGMNEKTCATCCWREAWGCPDRGGKPCPAWTEKWPVITYQGMIEKPIIFSGPMVRAILEGRKTQTRRIVKDGHALAFLGADHKPVLMCPFGQPGDRLWVRETSLLCRDSNGVCPAGNGKALAYAADGYELEDGERWTPSIHMPRWASRISLEITGIRVERLQDISEKDARAEGVAASRVGPCQDGLFYRLHRDSFIELWESINGPGSWDANPWVWVIEFRRLA